MALQRHGRPTLLSKEPSWQGSVSPPETAWAHLGLRPIRQHSSNRHGLLSSQGSTRRLSEEEESTFADGMPCELTASERTSEQELALTAKVRSDPCRSRSAVWITKTPSFLPPSGTADICNYTAWWSKVDAATYDTCYTNGASQGEASELNFKKQFLQFHFLTTAPYPRLAAYDRMQFRFPVPLLNSEYSLQSHCFRSLEWPFLSGKDAACVPQKTGPFGAGVGSCIYGVCGPNLVNYLPAAYLTAYKHLTLELCHNDAPPEPNVPQSVKSCQPTVLTSLDAKGKIQYRWSIKAHQTMIDAWANNAATSIIEKGCYTCNTVPDPPSNHVVACRN